MHKSTLDWLRQTNITADNALAEKRWKIAEKAVEKLTRPRVVELLRLFLFPASGADFEQSFTDELQAADKEFPGDSVQELRLVAGLIMLIAFEKVLHAGDAFALGLRAASFPVSRISPVQPAILAEAQQYLIGEAGRLRLDDFTDDASDITKSLGSKMKALSEATASADQVKIAGAIEAYGKSTVSTISDSHSRLAKRLEQLAEETGLLWWIINEHSDEMEKRLSDLTQDEYALVCAVEATRRTRVLPPPPSMRALLARALKACKPGKERPVLTDYLEATEAGWRAAQVKAFAVTECRDLVPICAALEKTEELGSASLAAAALKKVCPGVAGDLELQPSQAAEQFYTELAFLRALECI